MFLVFLLLTRLLRLSCRSMGILLPPVSQVTNTRINHTQHHRNRSLDSALQRIPEVSNSYSFARVFCQCKSPPTTHRSLSLSPAHPAVPYFVASQTQLNLATLHLCEAHLNLESFQLFYIHSTGLCVCVCVCTLYNLLGYIFIAARIVIHTQFLHSSLFVYISDYRERQQQTITITTTCIVA